MALSPYYVKKKFNEAIEAGSLVRVTYNKKTTERIVVRDLEPYEIKVELTKEGFRTYMYGYDVSKNTRKRKIKKWIVGRFHRIILMNKPFKPRWPLKFFKM